MIYFNIPPCAEKGIKYIQKAIDSHKICGDGEYTKKCQRWMENRWVG